MDSSKPWFLSRTVWASLVTVAAAIGGLIGIKIAPAEQAMMTDVLLQMVGAIGGVIAVLGRLTATEKIG